MLPLLLSKPLIFKEGSAMKKYVPLCLALSLTLSLSLFAEKPRRFVEFGSDLEAGLGNNWIGLRDILKKHILLDLNVLDGHIGKEGVSLHTDITGSVFFNFNAGEKWGFGISSNLEGAINGTIPQTFVTLITQGNKNNPVLEGDFTVYGSLFLDAALDVHARFGKLRVGLIPALYVPLLYIPQSTISYALHAEDQLSAQATGEIAIYSPFSLEQFQDGAYPTANALLEGAGVDISLQGEYALLPMLDLGGTLSHVPLSGSVLHNQMRLSSDFKIDGGNLLQDQNLEIPEFTLQEEYLDDVSYKVFRPLRFDVYALYRPVDFFTLRPNIGFTHILGGGISPLVNVGFEVRLNVLRIFFLHLGTGYEEAFWRHRLGFALNLRVLEVDLEAGLKSPDFEKSFNMQGASVNLGIRVGF
jgi:hypothetical protein